jgi:hypothetical protein
LCCGSKRKCSKAKKKQEHQKKVKCRNASKQVHALEVAGEFGSVALFFFMFSKVIMEPDLHISK